LFGVFAVCAVSALLGWLSGYNFDERNIFVALWVCFTLYCAAAITSLVFVKAIP
jgi:hypothetical protein